MEDLRSGEGLRDRPELTNSTRQGGVGEVSTNPRIIVDMREFRSELPSVIHKRGIDVEPVTLQVNLFCFHVNLCFY